ncbi:hypothetical protein A3Q56_04946 [Intoshia linei]|uniref:Uncharacterized protein n=1 Tax=Intoshia linei TaxID=1819745 RepID=A0A177AZ57_9BILA|nr:hypothetical protein A3Q56_04946 [Intoshia linei]
MVEINSFILQCFDNTKLQFNKITDLEDIIFNKFGLLLSNFGMENLEIILVVDVSKLRIDPASLYTDTSDDLTSLSNKNLNVI